MVVITVQAYKNAEVHTITVGKRELFWVKMIDVQHGLHVKNISHLVRKEIQGIYENKYPTEEQIRKYKHSEKELDTLSTTLVFQLNMFGVILWKK